MPQEIKKLIDGNNEWVESVKKTDPHFFDDLEKGQTPDFLWIGCSDSRVPATQLTNTMPGSIFVHRNIANLVVHTDINLLSVVYYAVKALKVKHIIVCGHYGCGGVQAAMGNDSFDIIDNWVRNIKDVYNTHKAELGAISSESDRFNRLVELNVEEQVNNLSKISFIQEEWKGGNKLQIHGWVYKLNDGKIKDLNVSVDNPENLDAVYKFN